MTATPTFFASAEPRITAQEAVPRRAGVAGISAVSAGLQDDIDVYRGRRRSDWHADTEEAANTGFREDIHTVRRKKFRALLRDTPRPPVTHEDLDNMWQYFDQRLYKDKNDLRINVSQLSVNLETEVAGVRAVLFDEIESIGMQRQRDAIIAKDFALSMGDRIEKDLHQLVEHQNNNLNMAMYSVQQQFADAQDRDIMDKDMIMQRIEALTAETAASMSVRWCEQGLLMRGLGEGLRAEIEAMGDSVRSSFQSALEELRLSQASNLEQAAKAHSSSNLDLVRDGQDRHDRLCEQVEGIKIDIVEKSDVVEKNRMRASKELEAQILENRTLSQEDILRMEDLHHRLYLTVAAVENISTRRIEWNLLGHISLESLQTSARSWYSPKFDVAGLRDLWLELRFHGLVAQKDEKEDGAQNETANKPKKSPTRSKTADLSRKSVVGNLIGRTLTGQGPEVQSRAADKHDADCTLILHCDTAGVRVLCKLFIGDSSTQFHHSFSPDSKGLMQQMNSGKFCSLRDEVELLDDDEPPLKVCVEVLEVLYTFEGDQKKLLRPTCEPDMEPEVKPEQPGGEPVGTLLTERYLLHQTMESIDQQKQALAQHMSTARVDKNDVNQQFRRIQDLIDGNSNNIDSHFQEVKSTLALKLNAEIFENRWDEVIAGEVRSEIVRQQNALGIALDKEDQLIQLTEAMKTNLNTALALRGRGPPRLPTVTSPGTARRGPKRRTAASPSNGTCSPERP